MRRRSEDEPDPYLDFLALRKNYVWHCCELHEMKVLAQRCCQNTKENSYDKLSPTDEERCPRRVHSRLRLEVHHRLTTRPNKSSRSLLEVVRPWGVGPCCVADLDAFYNEDKIRLHLRQLPNAYG